MDLIVMVLMRKGLRRINVSVTDISCSEVNDLTQENIVASVIFSIPLTIRALLHVVLSHRIIAMLGLMGCYICELELNAQCLKV